MPQMGAQKGQTPTLPGKVDASQGHTENSEHLIIYYTASLTPIEIPAILINFAVTKPKITRQ